jgi:predicted MFS family arabinose efflux permease
MLLYADHNSLAPNLSAIAEEFNFSIAEKDKKLGGEIAVGFFIVGGLASVVIGFLADRLNRCKLFAFIVALGQVAGLMTYRARTYRELLVCRVLTGISIGGCNPLLYSILGDCYDSSQRVYVTTILGLAMSVGVGGGQLLAGFVGPTLGWRLPFLIIAVPALVLAAAVYFTAREPPRSGSRKPSKGGSDDKVEVGSLEAVDEGGSGGSPPISSPPSPTTVAAAGGGHESIEWSKVWELLSTKSVLIIYTQGIPGCIPWSIITVFLSDYLSSDKGLSVQLATFCMMTFGVGALFGQIFGGWAGQQLYNRDKRLQCIFMGSAAALGMYLAYCETRDFIVLNLLWTLSHTH